MKTRHALCLLHIGFCFVNRGTGWSIRKSTPFTFRVCQRSLLQVFLFLFTQVNWWWKNSTRNHASECWINEWKSLVVHSLFFKDQFAVFGPSSGLGSILGILMALVQAAHLTGVTWIQGQGIRPAKLCSFMVCAFPFLSCGMYSQVWLAKSVLSSCLVS